MDSQETLRKTYAWIEAEIERAKKPYADKFDLTSLSYCVSKALGPGHSQADFENAVAVLQRVTLSNGLPRDDVVYPKEALAIIDYAVLTS